MIDEEKTMAAVPGLKTGKADELGVKKELTYKKETYERLTTEHDFVEKSSGLASIGLAGPRREVILISEADERLVIREWNNKLFAQKKDKLRRAKEVLSTDNYIYEVLKYISRFTHNSLTTEYVGGRMTKEEYLNWMIKIYLERGETIDIGKSGTPDIRAAAPLSKFIKNRCGICRHYNLINSIVVADSIRKGILPHGQVRAFRSGGYAVMAYLTSDKIWVLCSSGRPPFYLVPLNYLPAAPIEGSNEARALTFKKAYGEGFYSEMFERLLPKKPSTGATTAGAAAAPTPAGAAAAAGATAAAGTSANPKAGAVVAASATNPAPAVASAAAGAAAAKQQLADCEKAIKQLLNDFEQETVERSRWRRPDSPCGGNAGPVMWGPYSHRASSVMSERKYSAEERAIFKARAATSRLNDDGDLFARDTDGAAGDEVWVDPVGAAWSNSDGVFVVMDEDGAGGEVVRVDRVEPAWPDSDGVLFAKDEDGAGGAAYDDGECVRLAASAHNSGDGAIRRATLPPLGPWKNLMLDSEQPALWDTRVWDYDEGRRSPVLFDYRCSPCNKPPAMASVLAENFIDELLQSLDSPSNKGRNSPLSK